MTNSRAPNSKIILMAWFSGTNNTALFHPVYPSAIFGSTEADFQMITSRDLTVTRIRANVSTNSKNVTAPVGLRDDGADVGTHLSITNGTTGDFDSGAISIKIASGSKINFEIDTSASASGSLQILLYAELI